MYAVFQSGGKQYLVNKGQIIRLEKLHFAVGSTVEFNRVIMIANDNKLQIGNPFINGSKVIAKIVAHSRGDKIIIIKFRRRKHFRKRQGHRQWLTTVRIVDINTV